MGSTFYSSSGRELRAKASGYFTKSADDVFTQSKLRRIHDSMDPRLAKLRESRDSVNHPLSCPIIVDLDVTGSMRRIPHFLIQDGLPNTIKGIMEKGITDPQILFVATGDHVYDSGPFQVGQFESGDVELDMWLERCWPEGGGGGNAGESYMLGWWFAAHRTVTDAWEKRSQKGLYISIGDEPVLDRIPGKEIDRIFDQPQSQDWTSKELLELVQQKWRVVRFHMLQGSDGNNSLKGWQEMLGQDCIPISSQEKLPEVLATLTAEHFSLSKTVAQEPPPGTPGIPEDTKITL
jgi:hypothetical protein